MCHRSKRVGSHQSKWSSLALLLASAGLAYGEYHYHLRQTRSEDSTIEATTTTTIASSDSSSSQKPQRQLQPGGSDQPGPPARPVLPINPGNGGNNGGGNNSGGNNGGGNNGGGNNGGGNNGGGNNGNLVAHRYNCADFGTAQPFTSQLVTHFTVSQEPVPLDRYPLRGDFAALLWESYLRTSITTCDVPYFRSLTSTPTLHVAQTRSDPTSNNNDSDLFAIWNVEGQARGTMTAPNLLGQPGGRVDNIEMLDGVAPLRACALRRILALPEMTEEKCATTPNAPGCLCPIDGCYCWNQATEAFGADAFTLRDFLDDGLDEQSMAPLTSVTRVTEVASVLTDPESRLFPRQRTLLLLYLNEDPRRLENREVNRLEDLIQSIINNENFNSCDPLCRRVTAVMVDEGDINRPSDRPPPSLLQNQFLFQEEEEEEDRRPGFGVAFTIEYVTTDLTAPLFADDQPPPPSRRRGLGVSLINFVQTVMVPGGSGDACYCPREKISAARGLSLMAFINILDRELRAGAVGTPLRVRGQVDLEERECPNNDVQEVIQSLAVLEVAGGFSSLSTEERAQIEEDCVTGYNADALESCDPSFPRMLNCTLEPGYVEDDLLERRELSSSNGRRLSLTSDQIVYMNYYISCSCTAAQESTWFDSFRRRDLNEISSDGEVVNANFAEMRFLADSPELRTDTCFCPRGAEDGRRPPIEQFANRLNSTGRIQRVVDADERTCENRERFQSQVDVSLSLTGTLTLDEVAAFEDLFGNTINIASISLCDPSFIRVGEVILRSRAGQPLRDLSMAELTAITGDVRIGVQYVLYNGATEDVFLRITGGAERRQLTTSSTVERGVDDGYMSIGRNLQSGGGRCPCSRSVAVGSEQDITQEYFYEQLNLGLADDTTFPSIQSVSV